MYGRTLATACLMVVLGIRIGNGADEPAAEEAKSLSNIRQVTKSFPRAGEGYFSPDGTQIVYQAYPLGYPFYQIYTQPLDKFEPRRVSPGRGRTTCAYFSPDGKQIVFTSTRDGDPDIYVMNADGSNVRQITNVDGYDGGPFFSPDDKWIIYRTDRKAKDMLQVHVISATGEHDTPLTDNTNQVNWAPYFHPNGKTIIWTAADYSRGPMGANFDLWVMDVDWKDGRPKPGTPRRVTTHAKADVLPVFSPDGKKLMWTSSRTEDGSSQLWIADWLGNN